MLPNIGWAIKKKRSQTMTMLSKGDKIEVLDEAISGTVKEVYEDEVLVEIEEGFDLTFKINEVVKVEATDFYVDQDEVAQALKEKQVPRKNRKRITHSKEGTATPLEVDLHMHELAPSTRNMSNFDMLNLQLRTAESQLQFAIRKKIQKVVFIHGVGEGILRAELETMLHRYDNLKFYDADYRKYGLGATEVYIFMNA